MFTHGAIMQGAGPDAPVEMKFHVIRFVMQVVLLTILGGMAFGQTEGADKAKKK